MLFDFESWRDFVEYRKMMISRFYFPLIFSQDNVNQETYSSYIGFLESLRLKEINIEEPTRKSGVKFEQKIRIRANAKDILLELIQKHNSQEVVSKEVSYVAFKPSLMPYTEYFEYIKESYADQLKLNQEILETNHQEVSLENFLQWRPFVEKLQAAGLDVEVQKSKINKNLRIIHQLPKATKSIYKLSHKIKEEKWVNYMKNREEKREGPKRKLEELNAYKLTVDKVLMQRKYWRDEIKYKKSTDKEGDIKT